jgi:hypothetical protein
MISAAPKAYFHDVVANHKDQPVTCTHKDRKAPCVHESHMNCHFDQLVVTAFFHFESLSFPETPAGFVYSDYAAYAENTVSGRHSSPDGRGPPKA